MKNFRLSLFTWVVLLCSTSVFSQDLYDANRVGYTIFGDEAHVTSALFFDGEELTIPSTVSHEGVTYPVVEIGKFVFQKKAALHAIHLPEGLQRIGDAAFYECEYLTSVNLPSTLTYIGYNAFGWCRQLAFDFEAHPLPEDIELGGQCFHYTRWHLEQEEGTLIYLGHYLYAAIGKFKGEVKVRDGITHIGVQAFDNNSAWADFDSITSVVLPEGLLSIHEQAFCSCRGLTTINFPSTLKEIKLQAFSGCELLDFSPTTLPEGVQLGDGCFDETCWLQRQTDSIVYLRNYLYTTQGKVEGEVRVRSGITRIMPNAFNVNIKKDCQRMTSISLPASLRTIGSGAFSGCTALKDIYFREGEGIPNALECIEHGAFFECTAVQELNLPSRLSVIEEGAFSSMTSLEQVYFPASLQQIGIDAFKNCRNLNFDFEANPLPPAVELGDGCFDETRWLNDLPTDAIAYASHYLYYARGKMPERVVVREGTTHIMSEAFDALRYGHIDGSDFHTLVLPSTLRYIGKQAFAGCSLKGELVLPASITVVDDEAFNDCDSLHSVRFASSLPDALGVRIGKSAFADCGHLESVSLSDAVTTIGIGAFDSCPLLSSVHFGERLSFIGGTAFYGCSSLASIELPESVLAVSPLAFYGCPLSSISVGNPDIVCGNCALAVPFLSGISSELPPDAVSLESTDETVATIGYDPLWQGYDTHIQGPGEATMTITLHASEELGVPSDTSYVYSVHVGGKGYRLYMPNEGYTTFAAAKSYQMPQGLQGGVVRIEGDKAVVDYCYPEGAVVPAAEALLIQGEPGTYFLPFASETTIHCMGTDIPPVNLLKPLFTNGVYQAPEHTRLFVFGVSGDVPGFYYQEGVTDGSQVYGLAGKAYLEVSDTIAAGAEGYPLSEAPTGIGEQKVDDVASPVVVYTLDGRRVHQSVHTLPRGVYVIQGRKVCVQ